MIVVFDYIKFWCALIEYCTYKIMSTLRGSRKLMYSKPNVPQQQHKFIANFAPIAVIGHACHVCTHVMLGLQFGEQSESPSVGGSGGMLPQKIFDILDALR